MYDLNLLLVLLCCYPRLAFAQPTLAIHSIDSTTHGNVQKQRYSRHAHDKHLVILHNTLTKTGNEPQSSIHYKYH